jgi:hypothetical protein
MTGWVQARSTMRLIVRGEGPPGAARPGCERWDWDEGFTAGCTTHDGRHASRRSVSHLFAGEAAVVSHLFAGEAAVGQPHALVPRRRDGRSVTRCLAARRRVGQVGPGVAAAGQQPHALLRRRRGGRSVTTGHSGATAGRSRKAKRCDGRSVTRGQSVARPVGHVGQTYRAAGRSREVKVSRGRSVT